MRDGNLNWVKVSVARTEQVGRVHAAIASRLMRPELRPPIGDVIVVEFGEPHAVEAADVLRDALAEEFGVVDWIDVEVGHGNLRWMYGDR